MSGSGHQPRTPPPTWLVCAAFGAVYLIWGSTYLTIRIAIDSIPPLLMAGSRFLAAGIVLYAWMRLSGAPKPRAIHWRNATIIGGSLLLIGNGGVSWAEKVVPTNIAALLIAATPLWILLIDWLRPEGKRPAAVVFAGLAIGFVGVSLMVMGKDSGGHSVIGPVGAGVLIVASICWAAGSVFSRHAEQSPAALLNVAMQMITGGILLLAGSALIGEWHSFDYSGVTRASAAAFFYLTIFGSLVGFTAYIWLLQVSTPARVATYAYVNPIIAVLLGSVFLGETLPASTLAAGALVLTAVVLITRPTPAPALRR